MRILITGADRPLGQAAARHLADRHDLRLTGRSGDGSDGGGPPRADLRDVAQVRELVTGLDAVLHLAEFDPAPCPEGEALEHATLGTYVLCREARQAGAGRIVVAGTLKLFDAYPDDYVIDEMWKPRPAPEAEHLAPYLCETVAREFVREGGIDGVCLRFAPIGVHPERNTHLADALRAIDCALSVRFETPGYRWHVAHVASAPRFRDREASIWLGFQAEERD